MIKKISALLVVLAFSSNLFAAALADAKINKTERQASSLAALLPPSDGVIVFNSQRLFSEALPQVLSANQSMLKDVLGKIDEIKGKTGIDLRQFEQFALGVSSKKVSANDFEFEPVVLARGNFNAAALISLAKVALNGKYREEKAGDKTIYIFTPPPPKSVKNSTQNSKSQTKNAPFEKAMDKMFANLSREFAVSAYDTGILAIGSPSRVRQTLQTKTRVDAELLSLVSRKPNALMSFGLRMPGGMSGFINLDNDELGKNIDSIRQVSGAIDVANGNATVSLAAKTVRPEQAQGLKETLDGLQMVGKALLGGGKGADKAVFSRMIENARISNNAGEVMLDLQVSQSDIDILVGVK